MSAPDPSRASAASASSGGPFAGVPADFPAALRELVEEELAAGNRIVAVESGFPAAPIGVSVHLASKVLSRPRVSAGGLSFYDRQASTYSGEWTDERRHFFVLEPADPPPPPPDMDAIRRSIDEAERRSRVAVDREGLPWDPPSTAERAARAASASPSLVDRFRASMNITYERWHDGVGYDLSLLELASPDERAAIEAILCTNGIRGWRDVEALATVGSPRALELLRDAFTHGSVEVREAILDHAPQLIPEDLAFASLLSSLRDGSFYGGLTDAIDRAAVYAGRDVPAALRDTLLRGVLERDAGTAVHFVALLYHLAGLASTTFDWEHRPFFLRFSTPDRDARIAPFRELCSTLGVDPAPFLTDTASG